MLNDTDGMFNDKEGGDNRGSAGLGATAGSVISTGAIAPIAGSMIAASAASVVTTGLGTEEPIQALEITGDATIVQEAPSNFFSLLQELVEMGGWLLILVILVPMVLGWVLPGPLEKKKKNASPNKVDGHNIIL